MQLEENGTRDRDILDWAEALLALSNWQVKAASIGGNMF